ncbi:MAG TPA: CpsD/CapB family tyrosine-protein kinase [Terriglobales bacterium]|nr:CpsD/CapB family tyrosine-protein kinase [Terriglobales bacterium]
MSRIFEALQRSESERSGTTSAPPALATELLQVVERQASALASKDFPLSEVASKDLVGTEFAREDLTRFQSLPVSLPPDSKLVCLTAQESFGAEKFRFLGVRLRQLQQSRPLKKLLITSTIPEEGKSTVSANLATILARRQQPKILLLEGDLRRPSLSKQFGLGRISGLSEWLQGEPRTIKDIYRLEGPNLWFLPAGRPPENPLELMQSGRLSELLNQLSGWFDWIIIDSPPILPLADTSVWARLADGILLVTREGFTKRGMLQRGLQALEESKLLGAVVNSSANTDHSNYYQRYGPGVARQASVVEE